MGARVRRLSWLVVGFWWMCVGPAVQAASLGKGSYLESLPAGAKGPSNLAGAPVLPKRASELLGPMPTNDWWSSLGWQRYADNPYSENLYAHPLAMRAYPNGLGVGYADRATLSTGNPSYLGEYHFSYLPDFFLGVEGLSAPQTQVERFSDWTVTAVWSSGGRTLRTTFGHGLPFVYATANGGEARVTFTAPPRVVSNSGGGVMAQVNGHTWGVFGPTGCAWQVDGNTLRSSLCGKDYFSVALLPDDREETLALFRQHAFAFVTKTQVSWRYDERTATLTTRFEITTEPKEGTEQRTLLALYPHQWRNTDAVLLGGTYVSPRGTMKLWGGTAFETRLRFSGVLPGLPGLGGADAAALRTLVEAVAAEPLPAGDTGTYWVGKALQRKALLLRVADELGATDVRDRMLTDLKAALEDWLRAGAGESKRVFAYEPTWGTLIGFPAEYGSDTELNDHHFHVGYFIHTAALVAQFDPTWAAPENWGGMVELLIRDANSPFREDSLFPFLRNFDPYAGHGWASGHGAFAAGNNQESSSEAMNFAAGVVLWGALTQNPTLRDLGIFLYANEAEVISHGWFNPEGASVFPSGFTHTAAGIVWGDGATYTTWFSASPAMIHGINFLPLTGGSLYLARNPSYLLANRQEMLTHGGGEPTVWPDIHWEVLALADPDAALAQFKAAPTYVPEEGESRAHTSQWLHALAALGRLQPEVTASLPTAAVFEKNGVRTYVAYNPTTTQVSVRYSDGKGLRVPPGALIQGAGETLPPEAESEGCTGCSASSESPAADTDSPGKDSCDSDRVCSGTVGCGCAGTQDLSMAGILLVLAALSRRKWRGRVELEEKR